MGYVELLAPAGSYESLKAAVNAGADAVYIGGARFGARAYADNPDEELFIKGMDYAHRFGVKVYMTVNTLLKNNEIAELADYIKPYYEAGLDAVIVQDFGVFSIIRENFPALDIHASTQMGILGAGGAKKLFEMGASRVVPARELSFNEIREIKKNCNIEIECFVHGSLCYAYSGQCLMSSIIGTRSANRGRCAQTCRLAFDLYNPVKNDIAGGKNRTKKSAFTNLDAKKIAGKAYAEKSNKIVINNKYIGNKTGMLNASGEKNLLSCKDLCSLDLLPSIIEAGVDSLKIEGRMKSPVYTAGVVSIYRKYLELYYKSGTKGYNVEASDRKSLLNLFDRGGQTDGYYNKHNGRDMVVMSAKPEFRETDISLVKNIQEKYIDIENKLKISGTVVLKTGVPAKLELNAEILSRDKSLQCNNIKISYTGEMPQKALKISTSKEDVIKRLLKTGNTPYSFKNLEVVIEPGLFIPNIHLNELRRKAIEALDFEILKIFRRKYEPAGYDNAGGCDISAKLSPDLQKAKKDDIKLHIVCEEKSQLEAVIDFCVRNAEKVGIQNNAKKLYTEHSKESFPISELSFEADTISPRFWEINVKKMHDIGIKVNLYMPHIFRKEASEFFDLNRKYLIAAGFDGFIIRCLEAADYLNNVFKGYEKPFFIFDYNMYAFNDIAGKCVKKMGADRLTLPVELNLKELKGLGYEDSELIAYGRLPMMISAQCLRKNTIGCDKKYSTLILKDRYNRDMPVKNKCEFCYNTIYNSLALSTLGISDSVKSLGVNIIRLYFTTESSKECVLIIERYIECFIMDIKTGEFSENFTRGHLKRGVE